MKDKAEAPAASAPPTDAEIAFAVGQLRHLYSQMVGGYVRYPAEAARGLLGPAIEILERAQMGTAATAAPEAVAIPASSVGTKG